MNKAVSKDDFQAADTSRTRLRAWIHLLMLTRKIENEVRERLRLKYATTLPRFDVMAALYRTEEGMKMGELSTALMVSNGNVTGIVERLVREKLVERVPVMDDRRAMEVRLTKLGRENFEQMATTHRGWIDEALVNLSEEECSQLICLADQARQSLSHRR
ncbi:MarR family winged helix-turn-helix transcriptional regulator [Limoniibacter endophyticus]|uniref:MarR family transcriptional regulator n=1 Tax=Limoniibacter endophyticus TaxID=1565040 RepID=A0A8J3DKA0_9HYPH|nr:MarR family transcriptional regulator [Limoniibacter endophyticus]GHC76876.1 MarR family transcriptional regulator [Limoniibacter endophyticus]